MGWGFIRIAGPEEKTDEDKVNVKATVIFTRRTQDEHRVVACLVKKGDLQEVWVYCPKGGRKDKTNRIVYMIQNGIPDVPVTDAVAFAPRYAGHFPGFLLSTIKSELLSRKKEKGKEEEEEEGKYKETIETVMLRYDQEHVKSKKAYISRKWTDIREWIEYTSKIYSESKKRDRLINSFFLSDERHFLVVLKAQIQLWSTDDPSSHLDIRNLGGGKDIVAANSHDNYLILATEEKIKVYDLQDLIVGALESGEQDNTAITPIQEYELPGISQMTHIKDSNGDVHIAVLCKESNKPKAKVLQLNSDFKIKEEAKDVEQFTNICEMLKEDKNICKCLSSMKMQLYERSAGDVVLVIGLWNVVATFTYGSDQKVELIRTNKASVYMDSITLPSSDAQGVSDRLKKFFGDREKKTLLTFVGVVEPKMDKNNDAQWHTMAVVARFHEDSTPGKGTPHTESLMIIERTSL